MQQVDEAYYQYETMLNTCLQAEKANGNYISGIVGNISKLTKKFKNISNEYITIKKRLVNSLNKMKINFKKIIETQDNIELANYDSDRSEERRVG